MGLFGNDDRLDALENHVRNFSDGVQQSAVLRIED
jgi:hypothetical protein